MDGSTMSKLYKKIYSEQCHYSYPPNPIHPISIYSLYVTNPFGSGLSFLVSFSKKKQIHVYFLISPFFNYIEGGIPYIFFFLFFFFFFTLFLAVLGLCCCTWAFSSCSERELFFVVVRGLLMVASLVAEHGL